MRKLKIERVWNLIFPPRCVVCDEIMTWDEAEEIGVHSACRAKIPYTGNHICLHCGKTVDADREYCRDCSKEVNRKGFDQGRALFLYRGPLVFAMYRFKYANRREYGKFFAEVAVKEHREWLQDRAPEAIIPVPMYRRKQRKRGYNQAVIFARELARVTGIPMDQRLIRRCKDTRPMKGLDDLARQENLKSAFAYTGDNKSYGRVLLVDDIYTTGSTEKAIAQVLKDKGIPEVFVLNICIGASDVL